MTLMEESQIFSETYDEIANEMALGIPGYVAVGIDVVTFRQRLWGKYRINKRCFAEILQRLRDNRDVVGVNKINLYGGPIYLKDNWVPCDGRHWLLIEVETRDHMRKMAPHRG